MRDYVYNIQSTEGLMTDFLVMLPSNDNSKNNDAKYFPLSHKIGMNKKTRQKVRHMTQDEDDY
jgi:hypothetical protein